MEQDSKVLSLKDNDLKPVDTFACTTSANHRCLYLPSCSLFSKQPNAYFTYENLLFGFIIMNFYCSEKS
jgi:hypothetical protein